jgi:hypothetical protein
LEPPPPPLQQRLDQQGSFEATGLQETVPMPALRGYYLNMEELTVSNLGVESLGSVNPLINDLLALILVQVVPPRVTPHGHQIVLQEARKSNDATSFRSPHTPLMTFTTDGISPPNPPSLVHTIVVSTPATLGSGLIPSAVTTTASLTQSATNPPFSYGMPRFDTNSILTYSTLQTMGLQEGISNAPLQGSMGGTSASYNDIPYGGVHIPPPSPSLDDALQPSVGPNMNYNLFGEGSLGPYTYTTSMVSMSFSLFDMFGNNNFSLVAFSAGGNCGFGQQNPVQGTIPK